VQDVSLMLACLFLFCKKLSMNAHPNVEIFHYNGVEESYHDKNQ